MLRLIIVWVIVLVLSSIVLARNGGGAGEMIVTWGFFLTIPALIALWGLSLVERVGSQWIGNMPIVIGVIIAAGLPAMCVLFFKSQMGWDVILQGVLPIALIFGSAWALSPRFVS